MKLKSSCAVIMSIYKSDNSDDFKVAMTSLINQTHPCDIYIYRDGIVPEKLQVIVNKYRVMTNVFYFESEVNHGLAFALNTLINQLKGKEYKYVARMDSDDVSLSSRIEKQVDFLEKNKDVDVCGTSCKEFGATYSLIEKHLPTQHNELVDFSIVRCPFIHPTVMFRWSVFEDGNYYPTDTALTEDMALWFKLLLRGYRFANLSEVLLNYRLNEDTIERRKGINKALSEFRLRIKYMYLLKKVTLKNTILITSRVLFHLLPNFILKILYKRIR